MTAGVTPVPMVIPGAVALPPGVGPGHVTAAAVGLPSVPAVDIPGILQSREVFIIGWFLLLGVVAGFRPQWTVILAFLSILGVLTYMHNTHTGLFLGTK